MLIRHLLLVAASVSVVLQRLDERAVSIALYAMFSSLSLWLFEYVFPETLLVALRNGQLFIVSGPKKCRTFFFDVFVFAKLTMLF